MKNKIKMDIIVVLSYGIIEKYLKEYLQNWIRIGKIFQNLLLDLIFG